MLRKHNTVLPRESEIELYQKILNLRQMGIRKWKTSALRNQLHQRTPTPIL